MSSEILDYIGLDIDNIDEKIIGKKPKYNVAKAYDNSALYRVYKMIFVKDIEILVSNTDRTTDIKERYESSKPLNEYIKENPRDFVNLVENAEISEIEKIEKLQEEFQEKMPYFVKYDKNYIWQIYYSKEENKYFMLFPARDGDISVLFYMIKQKIKNESAKIYVPICKADYEEFYFNNQEITDIENYIWLLTKEWSVIYEVERPDIDKSEKNVDKLQGKGHNNADKRLDKNSKENSNNKLVYIVGKTKIKQRFESKYRIEIKSKEEADDLYTLLKALFILTTESVKQYSFEPAISSLGELTFEYNDELEISDGDQNNSDKGNSKRNDIEGHDVECKENAIDIDNLTDFLKEQTDRKSIRKDELEVQIEEMQKKLKDIRQEVSKQSEIYKSQEKQIVMFLNCKKSFFKRVKFFFKKTKIEFGEQENELKSDLEDKKSFEDKENKDGFEDKANIDLKKDGFGGKANIDLKKDGLGGKANGGLKGQGSNSNEEEIIACKIENSLRKTSTNFAKSYTISDLIRICKEVAQTETEYRNVVADYKAMKIKKKNIQSKIKNAKEYLDEIEKHKKSIFDFWKFTSKDQLQSLNEGESQEQENSKLKVSFNFEEDMPELARKADNLQKKKLSIDECNAIYACRYVLKSINSVLLEESDKTELKNNKVRNKEKNVLEEELERLKKNYTGNKRTEIFGEIEEDYTKIKNLGNSKHRENKKNIYSILKVNDKTSLEDYTSTIEDIVKLLNEAYNKITSVADFPVYYTESDVGKYIIADIAPVNCDVVYKTMITRDSHILYLSNIIYYDNYNRTLPNGMDEGTKVIIKLDSANEGRQSNINIVEQKDLYNINVRSIKLIEVY